MEFPKPRSLKARRRALELLLPCLRPVQDDLGNVPVEMQGDATVNGTLIGLIEQVCAKYELTRPAALQRVIAEVFEEVYRREATEILTRCDALLEQTDSTLVQARDRLQHYAATVPESDWARELEVYIQNHYTRPDTLVL